MTQTIGVSVLPGPLTVSPTSDTVTLTRGDASSGISTLFNSSSGQSYGGNLGRITLVDARGTLVGWRASVSLVSVSGASGGGPGRANAGIGNSGNSGDGFGDFSPSGVELCITPDVPTMVAGNPADIVRGDRASCARLGQPIPVFFAAPGGGGGTYSDAGALMLLLPGGRSESVTATLAVSVS